MKFECENCGNKTLSWRGLCSECGAYGTIRELSSQELELAKATKKSSSGKQPTLTAEKFSEQDFSQSLRRFSTGMKQVDSVLNGGFVEGQVVALFAVPGTGKSTLLAEVCRGLNVSSLYVSAEESAKQVFLRHKRIGVGESTEVLSTDVIEEALEVVRRGHYKFFVIDSLHAFKSGLVEGVAGSKMQTEAVMNTICSFSKSTGIPCAVILQVTKSEQAGGGSGALHACDTILELSHENGGLILLRPLKNRFGGTDEIAIFRHSSKGLEEVEEFNLEEQPGEGAGTAKFGFLLSKNRVSSGCVSCIVIPCAGQVPARVCEGFSRQLLLTNLAVLENSCGLQLYDKDVYVSVENSGVVPTDKGVYSAAIVAAVFSAATAKSIPKELVFNGRVLLNGSIKQGKFETERMRSYFSRVGGELVTVKTVEELVSHIN